MSLSVLSVASEAFPLVKTGGLADVVGALPAAVAPHGVEMTTLIPGYPAVLEALASASAVARWDDLLGTQARLLEGRIDGHPLLVLDAPTLFARGGGPYAGPDGHEWADNWRRFAAMGHAAAETVASREIDVLHAHDWQAGMAPAYLRHAGGSANSVMTIHNIAFQGRFDASVFGALGLPAAAWSIDGVEYYGGVGFLKAGLAAADAITTVSPTYADEIRGPEQGMGLEGLIAARAGRVSGIVNGIDPAIWSPVADAALPAPFDAGDLAARAINKRILEQTFGIEPGDGPLFTVVSRLAWQKGMDVLADSLDALLALGGRLALLGSGDASLEERFRAAAAAHPGRVGVRIGYDEPTSHLMQGGGDAILVPSRFEPCGLTQLYGLAYGCVPVVARTGGLADTVIDANVAALAAGVATGIQFAPCTPEALAAALARTAGLYRDPVAWRGLQTQGMAADFSWKRSGKRYAELYRELVAQR